MGPAPVLDAAGVQLAAEVVLVLRLLQPTSLAGGFAGLAALRLAAELLSLAVAVIRNEQLVAMQAVALGPWFHRQPQHGVPGPKAIPQVYADMMTQSSGFKEAAKKTNEE